MAKNNALKSARKKLTWLMIVILGMAALIEGFHLAGRNASFAPQLALDLQGGTSIILQPNLINGSAVEDGTLEQAVAIIRQRVDATGVSEAQITTQGTGAAAVIVVSIPGKPDDNTLKLIEASALLEFRPVLAESAATNTAVGGSGSATSSASAAPSSAPLATSGAKPTDASDMNWIDKATQSKFDALSCRKSATSIVADFRAPGQVDSQRITPKSVWERW
jgi:preprotein translocase subunit SecD